MANNVSITKIIASVERLKLSARLVEHFIGFT